MDPPPSNDMHMTAALTAGPAVLPTKTKELHNHHFDSTVWNDFRFRDNDIIIATYAKSGTTWTQQIVGQMLFGPDPKLEVHSLSPWVDVRIPPKEVLLSMIEAQTNRRFLKTHLPLNALVFSPKAKYIYIGRDGRDMLLSLYNHHANASQAWYDLLNNTPGRVGPPIERPPADINQYFREWLDRDGYPFWSFWENVRTWWQYRNLPNVHFVHFANLKRDMPGEMRRIAKFLDIQIDESKWDEIVKYCTFDWMKENAVHCAPFGGSFWEGGAQVFINRGVNGRWVDMLTPEDVTRYEARAVQELGPECARWIATGEGL